MTDADDQGYEAEEDQQVDVAALQKKIEELEKDNFKYREDHRKAAEEAFLSKFGKEIAEEVADLPEDKREAWAEKLLSLQPKKDEPATDEPAPVDTPTEETATGLAAVVKPASGTQVPPEPLTPKQILELGKTNPAAATAARLAQYRTP